MNNIELTWSDITVSVKHKILTCSSAPEKEKIIIHKANGKVQSGFFVAIMGPSGAGKTTLLATLAGKIKDFKGCVQINGRILSTTDMKKVSGFMNQFFIATESLTVKEHLMFMIALKARVQSKSQQETLENLMTELSLEQCQDTEIRYLSGGEKKKVALAAEIVNNPLILYCDEPTTGLDSSNAVAVIESLHARAIAGKIVMFTIHQPSSELYNYFDQIILLASGKTIFQGSRTIVQDFFNSINLICPQSFNPSEFYLKYLISSNTQNLEKLQAKAISFSKMQDTTCIIAFADLDESILSLLRQQHTKNLINELGWLIWRSYISAKRNVKNLSVAFGVLMMTAIMMCILFSGTELNNTGVQNFNGILYFTTSEIIFAFMFSVLYTFPEEYSIFLAEESIYSPYSYFISKILCLIPRCAVFTVCFLSIIFLRIELPGGYYQFIVMSCITCIGSMSSALFGLCISANFRTMDNIASVVIPWTTITTLMAGIFVKITSLPTYIQWIKYLSPFYYIFQSLAIIQWMNVTNIECLAGNNLPCYKNGTAVLEVLGFTPSYSQVLKNMLYITIVSVCWSLIGLFGITRKYKF